MKFLDFDVVMSDAGKQSKDVKKVLTPENTPDVIVSLAYTKEVPNANPHEYCKKYTFSYLAHIYVVGEKVASNYINVSKKIILEHCQDLSKKAPNLINLLKNRKL